MTDKQKRFIEEYLIDLNATQAAIRAGYSSKYADRQGNTLLENNRVSAAVAEAMAERSKRTGVSQDRVIRELARVAFVNISDLLDMSAEEMFSGGDREDTAAVASVKLKRTILDDESIVECEAKTYDKLRALELLGKHLGMFIERRELTVQDNGQLDSLLADRRRRRESGSGGE